MFNDPFSNAADSLIAPAKTAFPIAPDDMADIENGTKAVYVGIGGNLIVRLIDASADVTFVNVADGSILPIRVLAVRSTGTTAGGLVGLA